MTLPKIDLSAMPELPLPTGLFAAPATSIDTDMPIVLMAYLYELSL